MKRRSIDTQQTERERERHAYCYGRQERLFVPGVDCMHACMRQEITEVSLGGARGEGRRPSLPRGEEEEKNGAEGCR